jgi:hypothetical protein
MPGHVSERVDRRAIESHAVLKSSFQLLHGDGEALQDPRTSVSQRLTNLMPWSFVARSTRSLPCWLWSGICGSLRLALFNMRVIVDIFRRFRADYLAISTSKSDTIVSSVVSGILMLRQFWTTIALMMRASKVPSTE